jgi:hypothetical protein
MFHSVLLALLFVLPQAPSTPGPIARFSAESYRIDVFAWSTDAARSQLVDAWNMIPAAAAPARGRGEAPARGARGTRGAAPVAAPARGGERPDTPEKSLAAALQAAESVGYVWTSESTGYSLRYAYRIAQPDGRERIILATDRRLGEWEGFSIIELRLDAKHEGEGKVSNGKLGIDAAVNTIAIENYAALPITMKSVKAK